MFPTRAEKSLCSFDVLRALKYVDGKTFKEQREATVLASPWHRRLLDTMFWAVDTWDRGMEHRLELHRIQMPPLSLFGVIVAGEFLVAIWTAELSVRLMFHVDVNLLIGRVELHICNKPRRLKSEDLLVKNLSLAWLFSLTENSSQPTKNLSLIHI